MVLFIASLIAIAIAYLFVKWLEWQDSLRYDASWIDFNSFKRFYELNPKRWITQYGSVTCKTAKNAWDDDDVFCFRFIDYHKYRSWLKQQEKIKKQNEDTEATKRMMDVVREDIAKAEAEAGNLSNKSIDEMINILHESNYEDKAKFILLLEEIKLLNRRMSNENNH